MITNKQSKIIVKSGEANGDYSLIGRNERKEIINIIKNGNVIFYNDTKYKIRIKIDYSLFITKKKYKPITIDPNSSTSRMLQKNLRDMQLEIEKDGEWENVNTWPGNSNIVDTYDYKTVHINFGYFPDDKELEKEYQTKQNRLFFLFR